MSALSVFSCLCLFSSVWSPSAHAVPLDSPDNKSDAEDLGFVRELVARVDGSYPFDRERVYAAGYSNGGMMAFALACYASDLVAAVGVVSGQPFDNSSACAPSHATGVITLHGTDDDVLPYDGDSESLSAQDALDFWVAVNAADPTPATSRDGEVERETYGDGRNGVTVQNYRYVGGGHAWFPDTFEDQDATALVWDFVSGHDLQGAR